MRKKNSNWYYCNMCEEPIRTKEDDGLCGTCHSYLCLDDSGECSRCSWIHELLPLLDIQIKVQKDRKEKEKKIGEKL